MLDDIIKIMKEVFQVGDEYKLSPTDTQSLIGEWDSIAQVELVTALEEKYHVKFDFMDLVEMDSPIAIAQVLAKKLSKVVNKDI